LDLLIDANLIEDKKVRKRSLDILEAVSLANEYEKNISLFLNPIQLKRSKKEWATITFSKDVAVYFWRNRVSKYFQETTSYIEMIWSLNKTEYFNRCID
jgi:HTH-type transcriptional regulator/antitoxin HigA